MKSLIASRRDLEFQLFEVLDAEALASRPRFAEHSRETFLSALDTAFDVADAKFAPHNRAADEHEPTFEGGRVRLLPEAKEALRAFVDAGFLVSTRDAEVGGMQLPATVARACHGLFEAANVGTTSYASLTIANASLLSAFGTPEQKRRATTGRSASRTTWRSPGSFTRWAGAGRSRRTSRSARTGGAWVSSSGSPTAASPACPT